MFHFSLYQNTIGVEGEGALTDALLIRQKKGRHWIKVYVYCLLLLDVHQITTLGIPGLFNPLWSEGNFCDQLNQSARNVHSSTKLAILIITSTNNHGGKSVVLESSVKPGMHCQFSSPGVVWQNILEPLTQDANLLRGFNSEEYYVPNNIIFMVLLCARDFNKYHINIKHNTTPYMLLAHISIKWWNVLVLAVCMNSTDQLFSFSFFPLVRPQAMTIL